MPRVCAYLPIVGKRGVLRMSGRGMKVITGSSRCGSFKDPA